MNNRVIASRIMWKYRGAGASQLAVPNPRTESDRRLNRRVEILPISCSSLVANRRFLSTAMAGALRSACGTEPPFGCTRSPEGRCVRVGCKWPYRCVERGLLCLCERGEVPKPSTECELLPGGIGCRNISCQPPRRCVVRTDPDGLTRCECTQSII